MSKLRLGNAYWQHLVSWVGILLVPLMFTHPNETVTWQSYLWHVMLPLMWLLIFYLNKLWLSPRCMRGQKRLFWLTNTLVVLAVALLLQYWNMKAIQWLPQMRMEFSSHRMEIGVLSMLKFAVRDAISLVIAIVIAHVSVLSQRLTKAEQARKDAEAARREAELQNLRNQVNPHFLLNTLNNIYSLTAFDTAQAQKAILDLSSMLRHILYDCQQPMVGLKDEVKFITDYIHLMQMRVSERVSVVCDIQIPEPCTQRVAPMIFISLVENAFKHGISPAKQSEIRVRMVADGEKIECEIANTNHPKTAQDRSGHGVGLMQVARRLELTYKNRYVWEKGLDEESNMYISKITLYDT